MMMLFSIAWRNIWRNRKRSIILILAVILGISSGIFVLAFYNGLIKQRLESALSTEVSHIQIHSKKFKKEYDIKEIIPNGMNILKEVQSQESVAYASGRILLQGMIASSIGSKGILIHAIIPTFENQVTKLNDKLIQGSYFSSSSSNEIILSSSLASTLKVKQGNKIVLTFQDAHAELISSAFRIIGIYKTGNGPYDDMHVFIPIKAIDSIAGIQTDIHEIAIILKNPEELDSTLNNLIHSYPDLLSEDWKTISPELGLTLSFGDQMVFVYMGIILLALAFGIINTMMMSVLDRTREIGMLLALGMNQWKIFIMIVLETAFLICAGCPIGLVIAGISVLITHHTGIELNMLKATASNFGYDPIVYPIMRWYDVEMTIILIISTALLSAILPARKAISLLPVEAIKK